MLKFGFSEKATKFEKKIVVLWTRASCSVRATAYLSKSRRRFVDKSYYLYKLLNSFVERNCIQAKLYTCISFREMNIRESFHIYSSNLYVDRYLKHATAAAQSLLHRSKKIDKSEFFHIFRSLC